VMEWRSLGRRIGIVGNGPTGSSRFGRRPPRQPYF
jgi:hypothetical protein